MSRQLTVVTGATSFILIQLLSSISTPFERIFIYPAINLNLNQVLADTPPKPRPKFRYVPPNRRYPKSTKATGSRGCVQSNQSLPVSLTLLVPNDHDGLTRSGHPTFFWHVSASVPMAFALTAPGVVQPLLEKQIQPREPGIIQLQMPYDLPELVPGREYRWSVTLICNPERPSANPIVPGLSALLPHLSRLNKLQPAQNANGP